MCASCLTKGIGRLVENSNIFSEGHAKDWTIIFPSSPSPGLYHLRTYIDFYMLSQDKKLLNYPEVKQREALLTEHTERVLC